MYVPAGVPLRERESSLDYVIYGYDSPEDLDAELRGIGDLRLVPGVSLPSTSPEDEMLDRRPHAETLRDVWSDQTDGGGDWQLGGHAANFDDYGDPVAAPPAWRTTITTRTPTTGYCSRSGAGFPGQWPGARRGHPTAARGPGTSSGPPGRVRPLR